MDTLIITKVGIVDSTCNNAIIEAVGLLEQERKEVEMQINLCIEHNQDAFLQLFENEVTRINRQISDLVSRFRLNNQRLA